MGYRLSDLHAKGIPSLLTNIKNREQWEAKRSGILRKWVLYLGGLPDPVPVQYRILSETAGDGYRCQHIVYNTVHNDKVTAYLLIPRSLDMKGSGAGLPAVLALHPTVEEGKADIATPGGRENRRYGLELAKRGYIVLAPDTITMGERIYQGYKPYCTAPFYEEHPEWTATGKMLADHRQGIDLLCRLPFVNPGRIGAIGHSKGGYNAFFLAGIDKRIRAVVSSCGFCTFTGDPDPHRWGKRDWLSHIPQLSEDVNGGQVPFEWHEIAALAPVPFFNWIGQQDTIFPHWQSSAEALLDLTRLYQWLGVGDRFVSLIGNSGHDFPEEIREMAYNFLDKWLKDVQDE
ncbi:dienelactone hydrolase family protein [Paenactinomyces guangxiensis]|uniref:Acetylxylan esterase n=1 Tax=Paenactinomyces guangxiensis TaxID=1490290 RepID=A0A7W1WUV3_9BACL|nr:dienelactone hydrolase family protein [Paenactinomyces guangxiensis]MBA4496484.1 acetylxylan esterase [Paenactinomyces guangxiensis]MBH8593590.1 acetylxylan esterase [Paenactinomyces guangxiensis]